MEIIFHDHHATVPERVRARAAAGAQKLGARFGFAIDAVIRFEDDGPLRRAEIILHAAQHKELVAKSAARSYDTALTAALDKLEHQIDTERRIDRSKAQLSRRAARA